MNGPQTRFQRLKKLVLALFIISKKLKHYFQTFPITFLIEHLLRNVIELRSNGADIEMGVGAEALLTQIRTKDNN